MIGTIYMATCKSTGLSYIGQTINLTQRIRQHNRDKSDDPFHNAIRQYGREDIEWKELEIIDEEDKKLLHKRLCEREVYWIAFHNTFKNGYNQDEGGMCGYTARFPTAERLKKMSEAGKKGAGAAKGKHWKLTKYTKDKQSEAKQNMSDETKRKIGEANKARHPKKEKPIKENKPRIPWNKGKKMPKEFGEKVAQSLRNNPKVKGGCHTKPHSDDAKAKIGAAVRGCHYKMVDGKRVRYWDESKV